MGAYQFKSGAHIPKGVSAEGIMAERDRIEHDFGKATIEHAVDAVLKDPDGYPNLRAFGPADEGAAMRQGIAEAEAEPDADVSLLFENAYANPPASLQHDLAELRRILGGDVG